MSHAAPRSYSCVQPDSSLTQELVSVALVRCSYYCNGITVLKSERWSFCALKLKKHFPWKEQYSFISAQTTFVSECYPQHAESYIYTLSQWQWFPPHTVYKYWSEPIRMIFQTQIAFLRRPSRKFCFHIARQTTLKLHNIHQVLVIRIAFEIIPVEPWIFK